MNAKVLLKHSDISKSNESWHLKKKSYLPGKIPAIVPKSLYKLVKKPITS